jgi:hypothetical protein
MGATQDPYLGYLGYGRNTGKVDRPGFCRFPVPRSSNPQEAIPMQYLMLIYDQEADWAKLTPAQQGAMFQEYGQFTQEIMQKGKLVGSNQLKPVAAATTVRVRDGKRVTTDGPFAETKEQLGGYYLVEANDLDEAIAIAARIPSARHGSIEVRPIVVREQAARP